METISVVALPPIIKIETALKESDGRILDANERFVAVQPKVSGWLAEAEDRHFSGSKGTVYLKKLGHRPLTSTDAENLVIAYGSPEDKQALLDFRQAQVELSERLKGNTKAVSLVIEQVSLTRDQYYNRLKRPDLWKPAEIVTVIEVLDRLRI